MHLLLPLFAAIVFAFGSMAFKRAYDEGAGVVHAVLVTNFLLALLFLPWFQISAVLASQWRLPVLAGAALALGHLLNVLALRVGDVSVATPVLGAKVMFVVLLSRLLFHWPLSIAQWCAAALTTLGVLCMGLTDLRPGRRPGLATTLALGCAFCFSLTDVMIQSWAAPFGVFRFLSVQFISAAILSLLVFPLLGMPSLSAPRPGWTWILLAAALFAVQSILVTASVGIWRDAATVNILYSTRGLWSIGLVAGAGHWLKNAERRNAGPRAMAFRFIGAGLILLAVTLAVQRRRP